MGPSKRKRGKKESKKSKKKQKSKDAQESKVERLEIITIFCVIGGIVLINFFFGVQLGTAIRESWNEKVCSEDPQQDKEELMRWNGKRLDGTVVRYYCTAHSESQLKFMLQCHHETDTWRVIIQGFCDCHDELPPVIGFITRIPEQNYNREIGSEVVYKCSRSKKSKVLSVYRCNETSRWDKIYSSKCGCYDENPPEEKLRHKRIWTNKNRGYGTIVKYHCLETTDSAIDMLAQCDENTEKWKIIYSGTCTCQGRPSFRLSTEHERFLRNYTAVIGEKFNLYCNLKNKNSFIKYEVLCNNFGLWKLLKENECEEKYYFGGKSSAFMEAKQFCERNGGNLAQIKNEEDHLNAKNIALPHINDCMFFYIGIKEDVDKQWTSAEGESVDLDEQQLKRLTKGNWMCLAIQTSKDANSDALRPIINVDCNIPHCYICLFSDTTVRVEPITEKVAFSNAQTYCQHNQGVLAPLYSLEHVQRLKISTEVNDACEQTFVIGGRAKNRVWRMIAGKLVTYTGWGNNEPKTLQNHCVGLSTLKDLDWQDVHCQLHGCFLCETTNPVSKKVEKVYPSKCDKPWIANHDSSGCFLSQAVYMTSDQAEKHCIRFKGHLVHTLNLEDEQFLIQLLMSQYGAANIEGFHIGLQRKFNETRFVNQWRSTQPYTGIQSWALTTNINETTDSCGVLYLNPESLELVQCDHVASLVCRMDLKCPDPHYLAPKELLIWNGSKNEGDIVQIRCLKDPSVKQLHQSYVCSENKKWELQLEKKCETRRQAFSVRYTAYQAQKTCEILHGHLASAATEEDLQIASDLIHIVDTGFCSGFYVGVMERSDLQWRTIDCLLGQTSKPLPLLDPKLELDIWAPEHPNHMIYKCAMISALHNFSLINQDCISHNCFICEDMELNYYIDSRHVTFQDAFKMCGQKRQSLVQIRDPRSFKKLSNYVRDANIPTCSYFFTGIHNERRIYQDYEHGTEMNEEFINLHGVMMNFNENCMVAKPGLRRMELHDVHCEQQNCFLCEIPVENTREDATIEFFKRDSCAPDFILIGDECWHFSNEKLSSDDANNECLKMGAILAIFNGDFELTNLVNSYLKNLKSDEKYDTWHTGLVTVGNRHRWRSGAMYKYPPIPKHSKTVRYCTTLSYEETTGEMMWHYFSSCNEHLRFICRGNSYYLGMFKLNASEFEMKPEATDVTTCLQVCQRLRSCSHYKLASFISHDDESVCACSKTVFDDDIAAMNYPARSNDYSCDDDNFIPCSGDHSQTCFCGDRAIVYFLNEHHFLGCYSPKGGRSIGGRSGNLLDKRDVGIDGPASSKDSLTIVGDERENLPPPTSPFFKQSSDACPVQTLNDTLLQICILNCWGRYGLVAGMETISTSQKCLCYKELPHTMYTKVSSKPCEETENKDIEQMNFYRLGIIHWE